MVRQHDFDSFAQELLSSWSEFPLAGIVFGGTSNTPLVIYLGERPFRFLKLSLPGRGSIRLGRLALFDRKGRKLEVGDETTLEFSSLNSKASASDTQFQSFTNKISAKNLFQRMPQRDFQTNLESEPSITLDFACEITARSLEVYRRDGNAAAAPMRKMDVQASHDGIHWRLVHNGATEIAIGLARSLAFARRNLTGEDWRNARITLDLLGDFFIAGKIELPALRPHTKNIAVIHALNRILANYEIEITSHGARRSIRFWSLEEQRAQIDAANQIIDVLKTRYDHACFGFGTVLGAIREGGLIPHDDDLDIIVADRRWERAKLDENLAELANFLTDAGFVATRARQHHHIWVRQGRLQAIDVFVGLVEAGTGTWTPGPDRTLVIDRIFPPKPIQILDRTITVPRDSEYYLTSIYGADWQRSDPTFRHAG